MKAWRSSSSKTRIFFFSLSSSSQYIFVEVWVNGEHIQVHEGELCVRAFTLYYTTTQLPSWFTIHGDAQFSPWNATTRSELHNEHFSPRGIFKASLNAVWLKLCTLIRSSRNNIFLKRETHRDKRGSRLPFVWELKIRPRCDDLHSSARDAVPCAGPLVTHELRHW